jgi:hypothetical protein
MSDVMHELLKNVKGFSRVQITEDLPGGEVKIVGDSGWVGPNQITNDGFLNFLVKAIGGSSGSAQITHIALGTGTVPAAGATTLNGEISASTKRKAVTFGTVNSTTAQFTATFGSTDNFLAGASNLSNIGLFNSSSSGSFFAGNTYNSSSCNTNQNVNVTYQIRFS